MMVVLAEGGEEEGWNGHHRDCIDEQKKRSEYHLGVTLCDASENVRVAENRIKQHKPKAGGNRRQDEE